MPFTGKATFTAGAALPELAEDISDIVSIVSPFETPLLDALGDASRPATSTIHEWIEDTLLPSTVQLDQTSFSPDPASAANLTLDTSFPLREGSLLQPVESDEMMLVVLVSGATTISVQRGYGGTTPETLADDMVLRIIGHAALEGDDAPGVQQTDRQRRSNFTQILTATAEVSGTMQAVNTVGVADELDFQVQERTRELLRDLEQVVVNGVAAETDPQGTGTVRRTMRGIIPSIVTNRHSPGVGPIPLGAGASQDELTEEVLNAALREIWNSSGASITHLVCGANQKRRINEFVSSNRRFSEDADRLRNLVSVVETDFGVHEVLMSRWVPADALVMIDASRIEVKPLAGRTFHTTPLAKEGDRERRQVIGEYTLEMRNEAAHGVLIDMAT